MTLGLREHLATIRRHWIAALSVFLLAVILSGSFALLASPFYEARAQMLVLGSSQAQRATQSRLGDEARSSPHEQVATQVQIARSPLLSEEVARQIGPDRVLEEMRWRWDWVRALPQQLLYGAYGWSPTAWVLEQLGLRVPEAEESQRALREATKKIRDGQKIEAVAKSDVFVFGFTAPSPEFAAEVVNTMADVYIRHVVNLRSPESTAQIARQASDRLEADLLAAEAALQEFSEANQIFAIDQQKTQLLERVDQSRDNLAETRREIVASKQRINSIEERIARLSSEGAVSRVTRPNPVVDRLRAELVQLQRDSTRYTIGSPAEVRLQSQIETVQRQIQDLSQEVQGEATTGRSELYDQLQATLALQQADRQAIIVRATLLERQLAQTEAELGRLDDLEMTYRGLTRDVVNKEAAFLNAELQREETELADQLTEANLATVAQVEPAIAPTSATGPLRGQIVLIWSAAGLLVGILLTYVLEATRRTMSTPEEAEFALGLRVGAVIDRLGLLVRRSDRNEVEYRRFATWIGNHIKQSGTSKLAFASAHRNLAQADVVDQTAAALNQQGANVLIVRLALTEGQGVQVDGPLSESQSEEPPAVRTITVSAAPWALQDGLEDLLGSTPDSVDYALLDMPDATGFPERLQLVQSIPMLMLVVEADRTKVDDADATLRAFSEAGATLCGLVLNNRRARTASWAFCWASIRRRRTLARMAEV